MVRVHRNVLEPSSNLLVVEDDSGTHRHPVEGACLIDPPPASVMVFEWPGERDRAARLLPRGTPWDSPRLQR